MPADIGACVGASEKGFYRGASRYAWTVVGLLWVVAVFNYLDRLMITSMRTSITADIPMSDAHFGLLTSGFLWVYGLFSPVGGYLADRYSRKWVIMASLAVWSAMMFVTGCMHTFQSLLIARSIMGLSEACYIAAALALVTDYHTGPTRSFATALHQSGLYVGAALGGAGGWLAFHQGWRSTFEVFGGIGIGYSFLLIFALRERRAAPSVQPLPENASISPAEASAKLFSSGRFWLLLGYFSFSGIAFWLVNGWLPTLLGEKFAGWHASGMHLPIGARWLSSLSITNGTAGLWATVPVQTASFLGILSGGIWSDRWSRTNPRGRIYIVTIGFVCAGPFLFLLGSTGSVGTALAAMLVFGIGRGFSDANLMPIICQVLDSRFRATAYGLLNLASVGVGGLMIYAGGWLRDQRISLSLTFSSAAAGLIIAGLLMWLVGSNRAASRDPLVSSGTVL